MKPQLALLLCFPLIIWLWKRDQRVRPRFSPALWIPLFWLLVLGSRPISWWLGIGPSEGGTDVNLEGNLFDRILYLGQIFASVYILSKRGIDWRSIIGRNKGLMLFYLFLGATIIWSEYPLVTFRRWFKDLGAIFVILIILTEQDPVEAIKAVFARCAYILFPLSVVFIKYFPEIGREYSHAGEPTFTGVTSQKNSLGEIILVFGLLLISELTQVNRPRQARLFKGHHFTMLFILTIGLWLLLASNSQTSLICLTLGAAILLSYKLSIFKGHPQRQLGVFFTLALLFFMVNNVFQLSDELLRMVGRDPTLTHRTEIWQAVRENPVDPLIGSGYLMYWDLHKAITIGGFNDVKLNSAHNGYLEIFLDGGSLGICFLAVMLLAIGIRVSREFLTGSEYGRLAFAFYLVMLLYNFSESMYARRSPLWFAFLLFSLEFRSSLPVTTKSQFLESVTADRAPARAFSDLLPFLSTSRSRFS